MVLAVLGSLCIPAWPGTQKNPPATASQEVGLKAAWPLNRLIAESVFCHLLHKVNGMIKIANAFNLHLSLPFFSFMLHVSFFSLIFLIFFTQYILIMISPPLSPPRSSHPSNWVPYFSPSLKNKQAFSILISSHRILKCRITHIEPAVKLWTGSVFVSLDFCNRLSFERCPH